MTGWCSTARSALSENSAIELRLFHRVCVAVEFDANATDVVGAEARFDRGEYRQDLGIRAVVQFD